MDVFVTGATGFIGGTVAVRLIENGHRVRGLTRSEAKARELEKLGIAPVVGSLDDAALLTREAVSADATINAADSDHHGAVAALAAALTGTGKRLLHTSGSSIVGDDARGNRSEQVYTEDIHTPGSLWRPEPPKAARVAVDRFVLAARDYGVHSVVLCPTLIYGHGRGVHTESVQIPALARQARANGVARHIGGGHNVWSTVHVDDLADLYLLALDRARAGSFLFAENGEASFGDITRAVATATNTATVEGWDVASAIAEWGYELAVYALGSNSRVRADRARTQLGWQPRHVSVLDWVGREMTAA